MFHLYFLFQFCLQHSQRHNKLLNRNREPLLYQRSRSIVPTRYLKKKFTTIKWDSLGDVWKRSHKPTTKTISGLLAVKYNRDSIIPLYSFSGIVFSFSSLSKFEDGCMGVVIILASFILYFFRRSLIYFSWQINILFYSCLICNQEKIFYQKLFYLFQKLFASHILSFSKIIFESPLTRLNWEIF